MNTQIITGVLCMLSLMAAGCSSYYRVTDPGSGRIYYTTDIDERSGRLKFKDERRRSAVTLHSAEVNEISEEEYAAEVTGTRSIVTPAPIATRPSASTESF